MTATVCPGMASSPYGVHSDSLIPLQQLVPAQTAGTTAFGYRMHADGARAAGSSRQGRMY